MSNHECLCCDCMMNGLVLLFVFFFCTWPFGVLLLSVGTVVGKDLYYAVVLVAFVYPPLFVLLLCDVTSSAMLYPCMYLLSHSELSVQTHLPIRNIQILGFIFTHIPTYRYKSTQDYQRHIDSPTPSHAQQAQRQVSYKVRSSAASQHQVQSTYLSRPPNWSRRCSPARV